MLSLETVKNTYWEVLQEQAAKHPRKVRINRREAEGAALRLIKEQASQTPEGCTVIFYASTDNLGTSKYPEIISTWEYEILADYHETAQCYVRNDNGRGRILKSKVLGFGVI